MTLAFEAISDCLRVLFEQAPARSLENGGNGEVDGEPLSRALDIGRGGRPDPGNAAIAMKQLENRGKRPPGGY